MSSNIRKEKEESLCHYLSIKRFDSSPSKYRVVFIKECFIFQ